MGVLQAIGLRSRHGVFARFALEIRANAVVAFALVAPAVKRPWNLPKAGFDRTQAKAILKVNAVQEEELATKEFVRTENRLLRAELKNFVLMNSIGIVGILSAINCKTSDLI